MSSGTSRLTSISTRVAGADPAGLMYGAVVIGAVLATASGHGARTHFVLLSGFGVLLIYWLSHVYVHAFARSFHGETHHFFKRFGASARSESSVLKGGLPALAVFGVARLGGASVSEASLAALYFTVLLLGFIGYLGSRHAGRGTRVSLAEAAGAGLLGVGMVAIKTLLH